MPGVFLDTSAFAKLYIAEPGSDEVRRIVSDADDILVSALVVPETLSALNRLLREGAIDRDAYATIKERVVTDISMLHVVSVSDAVIGRSLVILERSSVRTLDALHIGAALEAGASLFVTADREQAKAGAAAELQVRYIEA